ncbi:MAG: DUF2490 domain-containing protein [Chitinophagaceae bacterium]
MSPFRFPLLFNSFLFCLCIIQAKAQKNTAHQGLFWYGIFTTVDINKNWYFQNEIQERHFVAPKLAQHQFIIRSHIHHKLGNNGWEISAGACLFFHNPNNPSQQNRLSVPEIRPHIETAFNHVWHKIAFDHRFRAEMRFFHQTNSDRSALEDGFMFTNYRFRYKLQASFPLVSLNKTQNLKLKLSNEIHLNADSRTGLSFFDQNRIYAGLNWGVHPLASIEIGYLKWYQQSANQQYFDRDILRCTLYHKIPRKKS